MGERRINAKTNRRLLPQVQQGRTGRRGREYLPLLRFGDTKGKGKPKLMGEVWAELGLERRGESECQL